MSSIIVLDSSDEEDEAPSKKPLLSHAIPATITPIKALRTMSPKIATISSATNNGNKSTKPLKSVIPGGITITARRSPVTNITASAVSSGNGNVQSNTQPSPVTIRKLLTDVVNNTTITTTTTTASVLKPQLPTVPKISAAFRISKIERRTPTPPKGQQQQQQQPAIAQLSQLPAPPHLPQLQPAPHIRKRKTPTPPQQHQQPQSNLSAQPINTSPVVEPPILIPMISSVQSMAAGATPPLQLMATPPHPSSGAIGSTGGFHELTLINPHLIHTTLPACTTLTETTNRYAQPQPQAQQQQLTANNNNNNDDNSYKIHLPPKRNNSASSAGNNKNITTSITPIASPAPTLRTPPASAPAPPPTISAQQSAAATPTATAPGSPFNSPHTANLLKVNTTITTTKGAEKRRIKPTTLLKHNDEAWLQRQRLPSVLSLNDDVTVEVLPSTSTQVLNPPKCTPTTARPTKRTKVQLAPVTRTPSAPSAPADSPEIQNSIRPVHHSAKSVPAATAIMDLTETPDKIDLSLVPLQAAISMPPTSPHFGGSGGDRKLNGETSTKHSNCISWNASASPSTTSTEAVAEAETETESKKDTSLTDSSPAQEPMETEYAELIKACREADSSADMERLIEMKLVKYYYGVHPDFVKSRGFRKSLRAVTERIRAEPDLVYYNIKTIVDELKVRRKSKAVVVNNEEANSSNSTGNKRTDEQIKKLNKALYILTKRIEQLEESEVDWDDDDSTYLQVERYKKRACQIYEKICDLTGESKNAHRLVKKPIQFSGTTFPQFNKTLQAYINRTKEFPDYYDVMRMLEHCNRQYTLGLANFEMKRIAQDAFTKVGKLLQSRRKTDLYETVTHFTANAKDPAASDPILQAKLSENQKNQTKISTIIEKFAREQDLTSEEQKEARLQEKLKANNAGELAEITAGDVSGIVELQPNGTDIPSNAVSVTSEQIAAGTASTAFEDDEDDEEEDEDDEDEVDINDLEADVEVLANGGELSEADSDVEMTSTSEKEPERLRVTSSASDGKEKAPELEVELEQQKGKDKDTNIHRTIETTGINSTATCDNTTIKQLLPTKNVDSVVNSNSNKNNSNNGNKLLSKTVNNNIVVRTKTGMQTAAAITTTTTATTVPNGTLNEHNHRPPTKSTSTKTNTGGIVPVPVPVAVSVAPLSGSMPTLKIVSVTSLNESVAPSAALRGIDIPNTVEQTANAQKLQQKQQQQQQMQAIKQRTVAEIVISDEES